MNTLHRQKESNLVLGEVKPVFIFMGRAASGKGEQSKILAKSIGLPCISVGEMIRQEIKSDSPLGRELAKYSSAGKLAPDFLINPLMWERLRQEDCKDGFILEGYARNVEQNTALNKFLTSIHLSITKVILLDVSEDTAIKRMSGGQRADRNDDKKENSRNERLRLFNEETAYSIAAYKEMGLLETVAEAPEIKDKEKNIQYIAEQVKKIVIQALNPNLSEHRLPKLPE